MSKFRTKRNSFFVIFETRNDIVIQISVLEADEYYIIYKTHNYKFCNFLNNLTAIWLVVLRIQISPEKAKTIFEGIGSPTVLLTHDPSTPSHPRKEK